MLRQRQDSVRKARPRTFRREVPAGTRNVRGSFLLGRARAVRPPGQALGPQASLHPAADPAQQACAWLGSDCQRLQANDTAAHKGQASRQRWGRSQTSGKLLG
jgi:hypothetical protein